MTSDHVSVPYKRDFLLSLAAAALMEIILGPVVNFFATDGVVLARVERLQSPGASMGVWIYRCLYAHVGHTWSVYCAVACAFLVLIAIWTCGCFSILSVFRLLRRGQRV